MATPGSGWMLMAAYHHTDSTVRGRLTPGTVRRIGGYARAHLSELIFFTGLTAIDAVIVVANPLLLRAIIDDGIVPRKSTVVIWLAVLMAGLAFLDLVVSLVQRWYSARIGEGLIYDLRTQVFDHVQRLPVAFFLRIRTGELISRLNGDIISAQRALTNTLSGVVSSVLGLIIVLITMIVLSWQVTVIALVLLAAYLLLAKWVGRKLQLTTREGMQLNAEMSSVMTERFNVAGATLAKLYGRPAEESRLFAGRAGRVHDIGISSAMYQQVFLTSLLLLTTLATSMVYGVGGVLSVHGQFPLGTLVALAALLIRLYGPLTVLSNMQGEMMTALVSFDRLFEILDLKPMIDDRPGSVPLPPGSGAPTIDFDNVTFRYPPANEVVLASLAPIARADSRPERDVLHSVSFHAVPGTLTALVGPSGAGKTTITQLISRLYDVSDGVVRIDGSDVREVTQASLSAAIGVVSQDPHMFHDSIRANLRYARPDASEQDIIAALQAAQLWGLVSTLPEGLDTTVGDRGYRLSGGEKARLAIARLLLKAPAIVIMDEATAHLDSQSEAALQRAMKTALSGRTSIVIAHRLSTIQEADQILVIDDGRVVQQGRHASLLATGGLYAELYHTQYKRHADTAATVPAGSAPAQDQNEMAHRPGQPAI